MIPLKEFAEQLFQASVARMRKDAAKVRKQDLFHEQEVIDGRILNRIAEVEARMEARNLDRNKEPF